MEGMIRVLTGIRLDDTQLSLRGRGSRLSILRGDDDSYSLDRTDENRMPLPYHDETDDFQIEMPQDRSGETEQGSFPNGNVD